MHTKPQEEIPEKTQTTLFKYRMCPSLSNRGVDSRVERVCFCFVLVFFFFAGVKGLSKDGRLDEF